MERGSVGSCGSKVQFVFLAAISLVSGTGILLEEGHQGS